MKRTQTNMIVVHCSATGPHVDIGAKEIDEWHRAKGWRKIGYHFVIRRNGTLEKGRKLDAIGAHVKGFNRRSIGICVVGGLDYMYEPNANYTDDQLIMLASLLVGLTLKYGDIRVLGHRDLSPDVNGDGIIEEFEWLKDCPCFDAGAWWAIEKEGYIEGILA